MKKAKINLKRLFAGVESGVLKFDGKYFHHVCPKSIK